MQAGTELFAFALTLGAGLATAVGGLLALTVGEVRPRFLSLALGFSAGVMIYVSMVELLPQGRTHLTTSLGERTGAWAAVGAFFGGIALIAVIDRLVPHDINPHEIPATDPRSRQRLHLMRTGLLTAVAIGIHNLPEGFATFMAGLQDPRIAVPVAVAIAVHNIPEGLAVAVPVYYATRSKSTAFRYALLSGLAEPAGALIGFLTLRPYLGDTALGLTFAAIAGIMVFVSLDELLPSAHAYDEHHLSVYGLVAGMAVMAVSLLLVM